MLVLIPLPGAAKGGVLALKDIQPAHDIAAGADGVGDGKAMVQIEGFRLGKGLIPGVDIGGDGLGGIHQGEVLVIEGRSLGAGALFHKVVAVAQSEGVGPGLGIGVVGAPVALHEGVVAAAADGPQEAIGGACLHDDVDVVAAQQLLQVLLHHLALVGPAGGSGVVAHQHLDGEVSPGGGQLRHGLLLVVQSLGLVIVVPVHILGQGAVGGVILALVDGEGHGGDGVADVARGVDGVTGGQGGHPVEGVDDGLAEILIVHGDGPVLRLILGVKIGVEVEKIPVGIGGVRPGGMDMVGGLGVGQHGAQKVGRHVGGVDVAALVHGGLDGGGLGVIGLADLLDKDLLRLPVLGVLGHHPLLLGLEIGEDVGAAVEQIVVAGAEFVPLLGKEALIGGHIGAEGHHGHKVGGGAGEGVLQGVVVNGLYPDVLQTGLGHRLQKGLVAVLVHGELGGVALLVGAVHGSLQSQQVGGIIIVLLGPGHNAPVGAEVVGTVAGIADVAGGGHPVIGGDIGHFVAVLVHPLDTLPDMEGPDAGVLVGFPGGGQSRLHIAVGVILHQTVHHIVGDGGLVGVTGDQIVQGGHFAGVEGTVDRFAVSGVRAGGVLAVLAAAGQSQCQGGGQRQCRKSLGLAHKQFLLSYGMAAAV